MRKSETIVAALLVIAGFMFSDYIIEQLYIEGALVRLCIRAGMQLQFIALIYLFFSSRDSERRLRQLESEMTALKQANDGGRFDYGKGSGTNYE